MGGMHYQIRPTDTGQRVTPPDGSTGPVEVDVVTNHGTVTSTVNVVPISPGLFAYTLQGKVYAADGT